MAFVKGRSGNPLGRPVGSTDKRTALRELLEPHAENLVNKVVELALQGDVTAIKICLDRLIPTVKSVELFQHQYGRSILELMDSTE